MTKPDAEGVPVPAELATAGIVDNELTGSPTVGKNGLRRGGDDD